MLVLRYTILEYFWHIYWVFSLLCDIEFILFYCLSMAAATQVDRIRLLAFRHIYPRSVKYCVCISLSVGAYMPPLRAYNSPINKRRWRRASSLVPHLRDVPSPFLGHKSVLWGQLKNFHPKIIIISANCIKLLSISRQHLQFQLMQRPETQAKRTMYVCMSNKSWTSLAPHRVTSTRFGWAVSVVRLAAADWRQVAHFLRRFKILFVKVPLNA